MPHSYQLPYSTHHSIYTATSHCVSVCGHTLYGGLLVTTSPIYNMKLLKAGHMRDSTCIDISLPSLDIHHIVMDCGLVGHPDIIMTSSWV